MRNANIVNLELIFKTVSDVQQDMLKVPSNNLQVQKEVPKDPEKPSSFSCFTEKGKQVFRYLFSLVGFAEPYVYAQLPFRAGTFADMLCSWFYSCLPNYYFWFNLPNLLLGCLPLSQAKNS